MASPVLDASAVLAVLLDELGAEVAEPLFPGAIVCAVNYAEVLVRMAKLCGSLAEAKRRVDRHSLVIIPFDITLAALAASLVPATRSGGLSLADCACLALGLARDATVYTADRAWAEFELGVDIRSIR